MISIDRMQICFDPDQAIRRTGNRASALPRVLRWTAGLTAVAVTMVTAFDAYALPLTPFRYEGQAQRHCPADTVVWLNFHKRIYYSKGQKRYARGPDGSFVCQSEARDSGYRRSLFGFR